MFWEGEGTVAEGGSRALVDVMASLVLDLDRGEVEAAEEVGCAGTKGTVDPDAVL